MSTMRLEREFARELAETVAPCDALLDAAPVEAVVANRQIGADRWTSTNELVVKTGDGRLWRAVYSKALTEYQDEVPFYGYGPEVAFAEVKAVPVIAWEYEVV